MRQILWLNGLPKEPVTAILMFHLTMKTAVCSSDGNINFFNIVAGVLQGDALASYLFIICLHYV